MTRVPIAHWRNILNFGKTGAFHLLESKKQMEFAYRLMIEYFYSSLTDLKIQGRWAIVLDHN